MDTNLEKSLREEIKRLKNEVEELENKPLSIKGKIVFITPTKDVSKKDKPFLTRTVCLDSSETVNGTVYKNNASFQFAGEDKCKMLDGLGLGDKIEVTFSIKGSTYAIKETDRKEGDNVQNPEWLNCITNLQAYKVDVIKRANNVPEASGSGSENTAGAASPETKDDLPF